MRASLVNEIPEMTAKDHDAYDPLCNIRDHVGRAKHPINCVSWEQAHKFCKEHGKRLPTEAEWELAARGHDGRKYPWGDEEPSKELLNACGTECLAWGKKHNQEVSAMFDADDGWATTAPVGSFPKGATPYGVLDMVGNVWEWVEDRYAAYEKVPQTNPTGPATGEDRVIRGGAWNGAYASWVRPTFRWRDNPDTRSYGVGFRCAKPAVVGPVKLSPEK